MCVITVLNKQSYLLGPSCDSTVVKVDERKKLFNYPKVYLLLLFIGSHQEKEQEYGNWDDCVN